MPTVLRIRGFRFHFYSDEGNEPPHIHVRGAEGECKFWLDPISLARHRGMARANCEKSNDWCSSIDHCCWRVSMTISAVESEPAALRA
ncbi:DUF4160 domain-containing protein [Thiocapsa sp.]|uniref:DUF4160 domain-containing protein n=1 Tax=Thiocapsa sp. TaxID=2024551 RepID=UPI0026272DE3|nr:DUF4160 domain-containing protein [Thiocapsa sp.]